MGVSRFRQGSAEIFFEYPSIISGTGKATKFKFGSYIHRVHANKSPLKFGRKGSMGISRDGPNFFEYPLLSQERVKLRSSNLADIFRESMQTKAP